MGTILDKIVDQKKKEVAELYEIYTPVKKKKICVSEHLRNVVKWQ
ncbi:Indole-3-glycerol phosphate synthase [Bacillus cereus]|nr:Indole-3-glycerol phosphate synthase [Bacillus cereus]